MLLSVIGSTNDDMEKQSSPVTHWLYPTLAAIVAVISIGSVLVTTGATTQKLSAAEENIRSLSNSTVKHSEIDYRLDSVDKKLESIEKKLDDSATRRR